MVFLLKNNELTSIKDFNKFRRFQQCICKEFQKDDENQQLGMISSELNFRVYHKMYQKSFEGSVDIVLWIRSQFISKYLYSKNIEKMNFG